MPRELISPPLLADSEAADCLHSHPGTIEQRHEIKAAAEGWGTHKGVSSNASMGARLSLSVCACVGAYAWWIMCLCTRLRGCQLGIYTDSSTGTHTHTSTHVSQGQIDGAIMQQTVTI